MDKQEDLVRIVAITNPSGKIGRYIVDRSIAETNIKNLYKRGLIRGAAVEEITDAEKEEHYKVVGRPTV